MAVTAKPFGNFIASLGLGFYSLQDVKPTTPLKLALFKPTFVPDYVSSYNYIDMRPDNEIDHQDPTASGVDYSWGGKPITTQIGATADNVGILLSATSVTWDQLTGTFRYGLVYHNQNAYDNPPVGLIDFGADQVYTGGPLTVDFPNGVLQLVAG